MMRTRNVIALIILGVALVGLAFLQTPVMTEVRGRVWNWWVVTVGDLRGFSGASEQQTASEQAASLRAENIRLRAELQDYRILREQLGTPAVEDWRSLRGMVAGRPVDVFHTGFVINRGYEDGVDVGAPVITGNQLLVGMVERVQERSSFVRTLLHSDSQFSVVTVPEDEEAEAGRGLLESRYQTSLHMTTIPRDMAIEEGEAVVTDSRNEALPLGLMVGRITEIDNPEHEPYQQARLELPYDLDALRAVTILLAP